jgi:FkbM family methyltransferase
VTNAQPILNRLPHIISKRYRALQWGCFFGKSDSFTLPSSVKLGGKRLPASFPDQIGVKVAYMEVLLEDCYGLRTVRPKARAVLDIGANVGIFALAARRAFPDAVIHSYEPNGSLERYLKVQMHAARTTCFLEAVAREDGKVSMHLAEDSVTSRSENTDSGEIPAVSFRKTIERLGGNVDFAKVDCEGAEWEFLEDLEAWRRVRQMSMEYHLTDGHTHEDADRAMDRLGFRVTSITRAPTFGLLQALRV